jgi:hypothetical protein
MFELLTFDYLVNNLTFQEVSLYSHLVDILTFFVRQQWRRCTRVIHDDGLSARIAQLMTVPQKHMKLSTWASFSAKHQASVTNLLPSCLKIFPYSCQPSRHLLLRPINA